MSAPVSVIGMGAPDGGDDAVGCAVVAALQLPDCETLRTNDVATLIDRLQTAELVVVVDACRARPAGRVREVFVDELARLPARSSHAIGLGEAIALGRALGGRALVRVVAIHIDEVGAGDRLSPIVAEAVTPAIEQVTAMVDGWRGSRAPRR